MQSKLAFVTDTDAASITLDFNVSHNHQITVAGNRTLVFSNPESGEVYRIKITQDSSGSRLITWPDTVKWAGGSAPTLTTTAARTDLIELLYDGSKYIDLNIVKNINLA